MTDLFSPEALATYLVTAIYTAFSLLIIYLIVKKLLYKPINEMLEKRKALIASQLDEAAQKNREAKDASKAAQKNLDDSHAKAAQIVAEANSRALLEAERTHKAAQTEALELHARAEEEIKHERSAMVQDLRSEVTSLSMAIATKLVGESVDTAASRKKVDHWIDEQFSSTDAVKEGEHHE